MFATGRAGQVVTGERKILVLPFESKAPWTMHMFTTLISLIYSGGLVFAYEGRSIGLHFAVNCMSLVATIPVTSSRYVFCRMNLAIFIMKIILTVTFLAIEAANDNRVGLIIYYAISLLMEIVSGSIYNHFVNNPPNNGDDPIESDRGVNIGLTAHNSTVE